MARTAPVPNIPAIPGMNPGTFILGGGGAGGGGGGAGGGGSGDGQGGNGGNGGNGAKGGGKQAPDPKKYPTCGTKSHPVDVVTGRAFTHPIVDFELPGPLPLRFARTCSSTIHREDAGLGWGWAHTFGWRIEVQRQRVRVWNESGTALDFPVPHAGETAIGPWGWILRRDGERSFSLDADDGGVWRFFEPSNDAATQYRLSVIADRNRNRIQLLYADGRLTKINDAAGRTIHVLSTHDGRIAAFLVKNAAARGRWIELARYSYDARGCLIEATDPDGHAWRYEYDDDRRLTKDTDRTGLTFHFLYDRQGRCVESWGAYDARPDPSLAPDLPPYLHDRETRAKGIHHCRFHWYPDGYSEVVDSTQVSRFFGNSRGTIDKSCEGPGVWSYAYDEHGFQTRSVDPEGGTTHYERDRRGRLLRLTDALGRAMIIERDAEGLPVCITDPEGGNTRLWRDRFGNVEGVQDASGATTMYTRDERGLVTAVHHANGATSRFEYL
ncbi:uncharacterized protein SOCEGT47_033760 [Sorangium cellulosum]|uniref:DUF6531 domain-containing protein n=2 Tax=Sorangium cellulosum TaxID=56 RepID=A0A4P2Q120_SORCE|nr:uncharacterized protein SOCEGT47_033760 [Sorangium cellulosum]